MATLLHTYRFVGEHAVLVVGECADRDRVLVSMEGGPPRAPIEFSILLTPENWDAIYRFDPLNQAETEVTSGMMQALTFLSDEENDTTSLEIRETADGGSVRIVMKGSNRPDPDDVLFVDLDVHDWNAFSALDLLSAASRDGRDRQSSTVVKGSGGDGAVH